MNSDEYEVHPLDKDYSVPQPPPRKIALTGEMKLRRGGVGIFGFGFLLTFLAAIMITNFPATWMERLGSEVHRMGMIGILIGGIVIVASYRFIDVPEHDDDEPQSYREFQRRRQQHR